jgi:hypothetical protein
MTTKLTLTIEDKVIKTAKTYAKKKGRSLSGLVENYLKSLSTDDKSSNELSPRIQRLKGAIKLPKDVDYKTLLEEAISKKHRK